MKDETCCVLREASEPVNKGPNEQMNKRAKKRKTQEVTRNTNGEG
jgi:hypothetical protein